MRRKHTLILVLLTYLNCNAGWYECYNFKGFIDNNPITLSIQIREGYFGEKDKKALNVIGVYKYDIYNNPIYVEGILDRNSHEIKLTEHLDSIHNAIFEFNMKDSSVVGKWYKLNSEIKYNLSLHYVSKLIDTLETDEYKDIEILQQESNKKYYFIAEYSKFQDEYRAKMTKLNIYNKKTNQLFQTIDFSNSEIAMGNIMTIIYQNVSLVSNKGFYITIDQGKMGNDVYFEYNSKKMKYLQIEDNN